MARYRKGKNGKYDVYVMDNLLCVMLAEWDESFAPVILQPSALLLNSMQMQPSSFKEFDQAWQIAKARIEQILNKTPEALADNDRIFIH